MRLTNSIERYTAIILGLALLTLIVAECSQVFLRYTFDKPVIWADDIKALLLMSLGWLGAAYLWMTRGHLDIIFFGPRFGIPIRYVRFFCDITVVVGVPWLLPKFLEAMLIYNSLVMPILPLPLGVKFIPPIIGLGLIALSALLRLMHECQAHKPRKPPM